MTGALVSGLPGAPRYLGGPTSATAAPSNASIGDLVWNDLNGNDVKEVTEPGLSGVTVSLLGAGRDGAFGTSDDKTFTPKTTSAAGTYTFTSLAGGSYRVTVTLPTGFTATTANPLVVSLADAQIYTAADFGVRQTNASIGDLAYRDTDEDGTFDTGEPGFSGVAVTLKENGTTKAATTTAANGSYSIAGLPAGSYTVEVATPTNYVATTPTTVAVTLAAGQAFPVADFGFREADSSVGDMVWEDENGNGALDAGEVGRAGVVVTLTKSGQTVAVATTDNAGLYRFDGLRSGTYTATVTIPVGYAATNSASRSITLAVAQAYTLADFGVRQSNSSVGDFVFGDTNGNGTFDAGESGKAGVSLTLRSGTATVATTSNASGNYVFSNLPAGSYTVTAEALPATPTTPSPFAVTLAKGESYVGADFGMAYIPGATVTLDQAAVSTVAGNGTVGDVDGTGQGASFADMGATTVQGDSVYQATAGAIRRIVRSTGAVTTLTGGGVGCVASSTPSAVRLGTINALASDGSSLYGLDRGCGVIWKVSLATRATSSISAPISPRSLTYGPDGWLYVATLSTVHRVDPSTGAGTLFANEGGFAIASDASYLWVSSVVSCNNPCRTVLKRIALADPTLVTTMSASQDVGGEVQFASAGDWLYLTTYGNSGLARFSKADGTWRRVAGTDAPGFADATGTEAWFSSITGLASDGTSLWVADSGNHRLRRATVGTALNYSQRPAATTNVAINPGEVTTSAGNGTAVDADGTGTAASFADMGAAVVAGGNLYQATSGRIRKVNLTTKQVTTLAGSAVFGCLPSAEPGQARFGTFTSLDSDGTYLYGVDPSACGGVMRISLSTGAVSRVASINGLRTVSVGQDGWLYASTLGDTYRVDRINGTYSLFATNAGGYGSATDATYLWLNQLTGCYSPCRTTLKRVTLADGTVTSYPETEGAIGTGPLVSAGNYLYGANHYGRGVVRVDKATREAVVLSGTGHLFADGIDGFADGTGPGAWFRSVTGIATDGTRLWVADSGNHRVRRIVQGKLPTDAGGPTPRERLGGNCVCAEHDTGGAPMADPVDPSTGNFYESTTDVAVPGRGFALAFTRSYSSLAAWTDGPLGWGWTHSYAVSLADSPYQANVKLVKQENGSEVAFSWTGSAWVPPSRVLATLVQNGDGTWTYTRRGGDRFVFDSAGRLVRQVDRNGYATTLGYDGAGKLTTITDPASRQLTLTWTGSRITRVADFTGRDVTYAYDAAGNLADVTDAAEGNTHFGYEAGHLLITVRDPRANTVTTNTFDAGRRLLTQKDALQKTTTFAYSEDGTVTVTDPTGRVERRVHADGLLLAETHGWGTAQAATSSYEYDPVSLGVVAVTDPNNHVRRRTYDTRGNALTSTDALNRTTTVTYNAYDEPLTVTDARNVTTTMAYDANGNLLTRSTPLTGTSQVQTTTYHHDDPAHPGDVTSVTDPVGKTWAVQYDGVGNLVRSTDPLGNAATSGYDALGRPTSTTSPKGNATGGVPADYTTTATYNAFGDVLVVTDPLGHQTVHTYDPNGNVATVRDAGNHTTTRTYDASNRLRTTTRPDTTTLGYDYDDAGRLTVQRDGAGRPTTYGYDVLGRVASSTDPLNRTTSFGYDGAGNRTSLTAADGGVTTFSFDDEDRPAGIAYSDGTTPAVTMGYDELGRRTSMIDGTGTSSWTWDSLSRLVSRTDGAGATVGYGWDLAGRQTSLVYPGGSTVGRGYDDAGRLTSVTDWQSRTFGFSWDPNGNLVGRTVPNGTSTSAVADRADRLASIEHRLSGNSFASFTYGRDDEDRITSTTPTGVGSPETYTYSALDRLATLDGAGYAHDAADNLTALPDGTTFAHDAAGQLQSQTAGGQTTTYSFDSRGNRTALAPPTGPATTLGWDQANRLKTFGATATYAYDGDGQRSSKTVSGVTQAFVWDTSGGVPLLLKDGGDAYVYGPDGTPLERIAPDGTATFVHADQLGSVRALTDVTGTVVGTSSFDPYGNPTGSTGTVSLPFGFAGEYRDAESGLVYLRARYYDPATAQFLSVDPMVGVTRSAYGYVDGDPLNSVDPLGLWGWKNVTRFVKDHAVEVVVAAVVVAAVVCTLSVACGLAVVGAVSAVSATAGNAILLGAAGIGTVGAVARFCGGAPDHVGTAAEGGGAAGGIKTTAHGATRIAGAAATRGGVLNEAEAAVVRGGGTVYTQSNGAVARVLEQANGRFSVVIDGERGVITTFQGLSQGALERLAKNYGWTAQ